MTEQERESRKRVQFGYHTRHDAVIFCSLLDAARAELAAKDAEIARLADWKRQQTAVEATWDDQQVATELGVHLGESIRPAILPGIRAMKAEIDRLKKLLDPFALAFKIIDALPVYMRPGDGEGMRDAMPGGWPTWGDCRRAAEAVKA